ncbi:MAG: hypothetical protein H0U85_08370 [Gemmatimonadales bacterium]|nr:hypothetical protein [Gemmatimonadales bacterium]
MPERLFREPVTRRGQPKLWTVLRPKWRTATTRTSDKRGGRGRAAVLGLLGGAFGIAVFGIVYRVLSYISTTAFGPALAGRLLALILLSFGSILLLSNLITALSTFFLARDLDLLVTSPLNWFRLYLAKLGETAVHSSWMIGLLALPVLAAYGVVFHGGPLFPFIALAALVPFAIIPAALGVGAMLCLVHVLPASRARDFLGVVAIGAAGGMVLMLRVMRPEVLLQADGMARIADFLAQRAPVVAFLPTQWAADMIMNWLQRTADPLPVALLYTTAAAFVILGGWLHGRLFASGFSRSQEKHERFGRRRWWTRSAHRLLTLLPPARRELLIKDTRLFFRDPTQWGQLILLALLVSVYVFNIRALPIFSGTRVPFFIVTMIVFVNIGLAGFVLAAVAARFVFPAVSLEGRQMWLLRSSPLDMRALLWSKYCMSTIPLVLLAVVLTVATDLLLHASALMVALSVGTLVLFTLAASAIALAFGTVYPQFEAENAAQIPTSFGGLAYMLTAVSLLGVILTIEAIPIASYLRAHRLGEPAEVGAEAVLALLTVAVLCIGSAAVALRLGLRRMVQLEL